ncbi:MAG: hypothetical protein JSV46_09440 [Candidatus Aminicenantes bacterium]|nr:MAG: hypothetical protein JSV46_09440 [Candidatus Aminicenantes bacterium]
MAFEIFEFLANFRGNGHKMQSLTKNGYWNEVMGIQIEGGGDEHLTKIYFIFRVQILALEK